MTPRPGCADSIVEHIRVDHRRVDLGYVCKVDVLHVELVAVELEIVIAHALDLTLEPLSRHQSNPVPRVAKLDDVGLGHTGRDLLLDSRHARFDRLDGGIARRCLEGNAARRNDDQPLLLRSSTHIAVPRGSLGRFGGCVFDGLRLGPRSAPPQQRGCSKMTQPPRSRSRECCGSCPVP